MPLLQVRGHPLATASASSANPSTKAINAAIPLARTEAFHCSRRTCPSRFRELPATVLRQLAHDSDGFVALDTVLQIGRLLSRAAWCWPHHHERNASGRRRFVPDDRLFRDGAYSCGTKGVKPHLKRAPRARLSDAATISSYNWAALWHPWFHREAREEREGSTIEEVRDRRRGGGAACCSSARSLLRELTPTSWAICAVCYPSRYSFQIRL